MKVRTIVLGVALLSLLTALAWSDEVQGQDAAPPPANPPQEQAPTSTQTTTLPAQAQPQGSAPLRVMAGKSLLINTTERLKRISITDPAVASAQVITPTQILVHGHAPGEVSLLIWDELERSRSFDLRVDVDVSACAEEEHRVFPDEQISVTPSRSAIVLSGHVTTEDVAKRAGELASAYSKSVVNVLTFGPVGAQEVLLQVKFAEVDRSALDRPHQHDRNYDHGSIRRLRLAADQRRSGANGAIHDQRYDQPGAESFPVPARHSLWCGH
jgi:Flp pilus assembly secretin CpaC